MAEDNGRNHDNHDYPLPTQASSRRQSEGFWGPDEHRNIEMSGALRESSWRAWRARRVLTTAQHDTSDSAGGGGSNSVAKGPYELRLEGCEFPLLAASAALLGSREQRAMRPIAEDQDVVPSLEKPRISHAAVNSRIVEQRKRHDLLRARVATGTWMLMRRAGERDSPDHSDVQVVRRR